MPSYRDYMDMEPKNTNDKSLLRKAIASMANAANKRLRRLEQAEFKYGEYEGEDTISGVRRFTSKGKNSLQELKAEFMRVRNFLKAKGSSLSGRQKMVKETEQEILKTMTEKQRKDFRKMLKQIEAYQNRDWYKKTGSVHDPYARLRFWEKLWDVYDYVDELGYNSQQFQNDSNQVRDEIYTLVINNMYDDLNELQKKTRKRLDELYGKAKEKDTEEEEIQNDDNEQPRDTSSWFVPNSV